MRGELVKICVSLPTELMQRINTLVPKGKRNAVVCAALQERVERHEQEQLHRELREGYLAMRLTTKESSQ